MRIQDLVSAFISDEENNSVSQIKTEKLLFYIFLALSFLSTTTIYFIAESTYDTGDGIVHYQIARYSWKHPHLLLYLWGKPFFTLLSSPFAQFGLKGMVVFQTLNAAVISWFLFSIASKINLKYKWSIPLFVFFAPVYFATMNSGLVEISFGTFFIFSVWLVFNKKFHASALVASILPFIRPEAYVAIPLLIAVYIYRKKYSAIPLLTAATIVYTIIGYFHFNDILWIIHQNYQLVGDNYAGMKGSYFHYFKIYYAIWGTAQAVLLLTGGVIVVIQIVRLIKRKVEHEYVLEVFLLFLGCTAGCFVLHSLLCGMPGILNNLGMVRYLATLIPSSVLIGLIGLNLINQIKFKKSSLKNITVGGFIIMAVISPFTQRFFPFKTNNEEMIVKEMAEYTKTSMPDFKKICYLHPMFPIYAELDPYDVNRIVPMQAANHDFVNELPDSTLFLWDSHFMEIEGKISLEWFTRNPNFKMLKHIKFINEKLPFETCLFIKADNPKLETAPVEIVYEDGKFLGEHNTKKIIYSIKNDSLDFLNWYPHMVSYSDKNAIEFTPEKEFGPKIIKNSDEINLGQGLRSVNISFNIHQPDSMSELLSVIDVRKNDSIYSWEGINIKQEIKPNQWNSVSISHNYQEPIAEDSLSIIFYIWNKGKQQFYIDDLQIAFDYLIEKN